MSPSAAAMTIDPITTEVIRRRLISIADQVDSNVTRTAYSPLVYEYKDYAVGVVDDAGRLLAQCTGGMPLFVADVLGAAVRHGLEIYGSEGIHAGDIVICNDAGVIGQHLNNVVMYTPFYDMAAQQRLGFFVVVMHWLDVGGRAIGSISKFATDIFQEGVQFNSVKLMRGNEPVAETFRFIRANTRFPEAVFGDIDAQIGACKMGVNLCQQIVERYGRPVWDLAITEIWNQSERAARAMIRQIPNGRYEASAFLDNDGLNPGHVPLKVVVNVADEDLTIDLSGLPPEAKSTMNAGRSGGGQSVARLAFRYLIIPDEDATEGSYRALHLTLPEGTIMSASPTSAKGHYNLALPTLIDLVIKALSPAIPDKVAAGHYATFSTIRFTGHHPETKALFQCSDSGFGGWGASAGHDGPGPFRTMCHGDTRSIPIEVQEATYPIIIDEYALRTDSGGAGEYRGGLGLSKAYQVFATCTLFSTFDRTDCPPWGLFGGDNALVGNVRIVRRDGSEQSALKENMQINPGDRVYVETGGGGGFGDPEKRSREGVRGDLQRGYVSKASARSVYGLVDEVE